MDEKQLNEFFDEVVEAQARWEQAQKALNIFRATPAPVKPLQLETFSEWEAYQKKALAHKNQEEKLQAVHRERFADWRELERQAIQNLPDKVWFRHGRFGIGIAWTDWGGSHYYLAVEPWKNEMDTLHRPYRGG